MRLRMWLLSIVSLVVLCGSLAWYWLLHTESGAAWALAQVESVTGGAFSSRSSEGDIAGGLTLRDAAYRDAGLDVVAETVSVTVDVDLLPLSIDVVAASVDRGRVSISDKPDSKDEAPDIEATLRGLRLPIPVTVSGFTATDVTLEAPTIEHTITRLELAGRWHDSIAVEALSIVTETLEAEVDGMLDLRQELEYLVNASVSLGPAITGQPDSVRIDLYSEGSPRLLELRIDVPELTASIAGQVRDLFGEPTWDLEANVKSYRWPLEEQDKMVELRNLAALSSGNVQAYSVDATGDVRAPGMQWFSATVKGEGNLDGFRAAHLQAQGPDLQASGSAGVRWGAERHLEADLAIERFEPQSVVAGWPEGFPLQGDVSAMLDEHRLLIGDSQIRVPRTGSELDLNADFNLDSGNVLGSLRWTNLRWPLDGENFDVSSDEADVEVEGTLDDWVVDGRIDVGTKDFPEGAFTLSGSGDRDHALITIRQARMLGGTIAGEFEYSWRGARPWRGALDAATLQTGILFEEWPGRLSGRVVADGTLEPLALTAEFTNVNGTLRGEPLRASGGVSLGDGKLVAREFSAIHGSSVVMLDGGLHEVGGLVFELAIAEAGNYVPQLSGSLVANGIVGTTQDGPFLSLNALAERLQYRDIAVSSLRVEDARLSDEVAGISLAAAGVRLGDRDVGELAGRLDASRERQTLSVWGSWLDYTVSLSLDGALADWEDPLGAGWRGSLETLEVSPADARVARLLAATEIFISADEVQIARACIGPDADENLCVEGRWEATGDYAAEAHFNQVPVDLLDFVVETGLTFDQVINGQLRWSHDPAVGPSGFARLAITPGTVASLDNRNLTLATGEGVLNFEVADNTLLRGTIGLPLPGTGAINGSFRLHDLEHIESSRVSGGVIAEIADIAILTPVIPAIDVAGGSLQADLNLTGSVEAPLLRGKLAINDGAIEFDPLGLLLEDLSLAATMTENYHIELEGSFRSGDGYGTLTAAADYGDIDNPVLNVGFKGNNLALVDVEDVSIKVDPDFEVRLSPDNLSLNGNLHVVEALVTPVRLPASQVHESDDVEIVVGELPDGPGRRRADGMSYSGSVDISLSDRVVVDIDVAEATVEGKVTFDWRGDPMPFANGQYNIDGTFAAFGQVLDITGGSVRFPDVPASEPIVRIRAEREIYGNTQVKTAGVLVDGPLQRPSVTPYTRPATTEERAVTLLVTGSDFDYEQGVGAIDFGTYVAPRLFVSYGIGVFERDNIVSARFDLSKGFGIKASSGDKETGIDLNYRFEN